MSTVRPEMNLNFLGLLTSSLYTLMQSKYTNITIFMPLTDFVRPSVYDCYWTLFIFFVSLLSSDHYLQDSKKNEGRRAHILEKGPGKKLS